MTAIEEKLKQLAQWQQPDGSFETWSSFDPQFRSYHKETTVFTNALILSSLSHFHPMPLARSIMTPLAEWLLQQKSPQGSFNYWPRLETAKPLYPDDLDDTFAALTALSLYKPPMIDGSWLANAVQLLIQTEMQTGGPYRTWLVETTDERWRDVDLAVNSNVATFLSQQGIVLPNLVQLAETHIERLDFTSPYYPTPFPVVYFLSRWYQGELKESVVTWLLNQCNSDGHWGSALDTALATSSLLNLGLEPSELKDGQMYLQHVKSWSAEPFCFDPAQDGRCAYGGAPALTLALSIEALRQLHPPTQPYSGYASFTDTVLRKVRRRLVDFSPQIDSRTSSYLDHLTSDTQHDIVLLPIHFKKAFGLSFPTELLIQLSQANLFGWLAATLYDDFLDGDAEAAFLPLANFAWREAIMLFQTALPYDRAWQRTVTHIMDRIDRAQAWEVASCRFTPTPDCRVLELPRPEYGDLSLLADRSLGQALAPLAMLYWLNLDCNFDNFEREKTALITFFHHFLIARQLHDEAHDWSTDLQKGHINAVAAILLRKVTDNTRLLSAVVPELHEQWWQTVLPAVCNSVLVHLQLAQTALAGCSIITNSKIVMPQIDSLAGATERAKAEQQKTLDFLAAFKK